MGRSFYIITGLIGFLAGVLLYLIFKPGLFIGVLGLILFLSSFLLKKTKLIFIFLAFLCFGLFRSILATHQTDFYTLDQYWDQKVELSGVIREVDIRRDHAKYKVEVEIFKSSVAYSRNAVGTVLVSSEKYPQFSYGDRVKIKGDLLEPGELEDFSYNNYLSRYGIYSVMRRPKIEVLETGQGNLFWKAMTDLQLSFMERINRIFPEPHASFEAGLLVGARKGIPPDLMEEFNLTGLTHIIAISGYNITIIIVFVMWLLRSLPRKIAFYCAVGSIALFTLFVGASPAVVRASIMGILGLLALNTGRQSNIHLTILWTAFFMVMHNPKILWWDVGFQLSFAAVLGLIYIAPHFEKYAEKLPEAFAIRESIVLTLAAQVTALPIIIFNFERLSLISPIANLLVAFALPPAMFFGFVAVLFSFVFWPFSLVFGYITWAILNYIIWVIHVMAHVPYASVNIPGMQLWMLFGYYAALIAFLVYIERAPLLKVRSGL